MFLKTFRSLIPLPFRLSRLHTLSYLEVCSKYPVELSSLSKEYVSPSLRTPVKRSDGKFITYKPITPGLRHRKEVDMDVLNVHQGEPVKELTFAIRNTGGRDHTGRVTVRGRGGGDKRHDYRRVDFYRQGSADRLRVVRIERDPYRSSFLALLYNTATAELTYIIAPSELKKGDEIQSFRVKDGEEISFIKNLDLVQVGNCLPLKYIPPGTKIHCVGLHENGPGILCRSAGTFAVLMNNNDANGNASIKMQSGELRLIKSGSIATIGTVSNPDWMHRILGKAGAKRKMGRRPKVRGVAQCPASHPNGGGEGRTKGKQPKTVYGKLFRGIKTRDPRKPKEYIIRSRHELKKHN